LKEEQLMNDMGVIQTETYEYEEHMSKEMRKQHPD
jgi:hypothetical protein